MDKKPPKKYNQPFKKRLKATVGVGAILNPLVKRSFGVRGFQNTAILTDWHLIVGAELAKFSVAERVMHKRGQRNGGVLHINVYGAMATEFSHQSGLIIEKINQFMGYKAVEAIKLHHSQSVPETNIVDKAVVRSEKPLAYDATALDNAIDCIEDEALRTQMQRLGRHIFKN